MHANAGHVLYQARRFDEAVTQLTQLVDVYPKFDLGAQPARTRLPSAEDSSSKPSPNFGSRRTLNAGRLGDLGQAYALAGRRGEALEELDRLQELASRAVYGAVHLAVIYASLGDNANALAGLEQAYEDRSTLLVWIKVDPRLDRLRSEPRFQSDSRAHEAAVAGIGRWENGGWPATRREERLDETACRDMGVCCDVDSAGGLCQHTPAGCDAPVRLRLRLPTPSPPTPRGIPCCMKTMSPR